MIAALSAIFTIVSLTLLAPTAILCLEVAAALLGGSRAPRSALRVRQSCAILVPAYDEALVIGRTLARLRNELRPGYRVLVVADNCSDDTAAIAAAAGAEVVKRFDAKDRGKSFALDFGLRRLALDPPEAVVVLDADCELSPGSLDDIVSTCLATGRPAQACYIIKAPDGAPAATRLAEFAQIVKNRLRPRGLQALGLPCQLAGSGMAFPWNVASAVDFQNGAIVEDLRLGLDMAAAGHPPVYCADALVVSVFPLSSEGSTSQRRRWLRGHLQVMAGAISGAPGALLLRRNAPLAALTLDLCVPPLTLLVALLGLTAISGVGLALLGGSLWPLAISITALGVLAGTLAAAWRATDQITFATGAVRAAFSYFCERVLLYPTFLARKPAQWVRTDRSGQE